MRKTPDILATARRTLAEHPVLWAPALLMLLLQDAVLPLAAQGAGALPQALAGLCAALGAVLVGAGWLAMVGRALRGGEPALQDFVDGVNARWGSLLLGTIAYAALIAGLAGLAFAQGDRVFGIDALVSWFKHLLELTPEQQRAALSPTRIPPAVEGWVNLVAAWLAAVAVVNTLLLFWQPLVVLQGLGWLSAWVGSAGLVMRRFGQVIALGGLEIGATLGSRLLIATLNPVAVVLGVAVHIVAVAFFLTVYATVVEDEWPAHAPRTDLRA